MKSTKQAYIFRSAIKCNINRNEKIDLPKLKHTQCALAQADLVVLHILKCIPPVQLGSLVGGIEK